MNATAHKDWRFIFEPFKEGLLVDFFTQAEQPNRKIDPTFSILISEAATKVTIWGVRRFSFIREIGGFPETRQIRNSRRPTFAGSARSESGHYLCHVEVNHLGNDFLLTFGNVSPLQIRVHTDRRYVEVWCAMQLDVYDSSEQLSFFGEKLSVPVAHYRDDESVMQRQVLSFPKSAS